MDLDTWVALDRAARARVCEGVASQVGGTLRGVGDQALPVATFDVRGREMVLVPGGVVTLGWDGRSVALDPAARARWSAEVESGVGSFEGYLRDVLEPAHTVTLAPFLIERSPVHVEELFDPYDVDDPEEELRARIAAERFRLPSGDEWEHAVRAGTSSLFRCPPGFRTVARRPSAVTRSRAAWVSRCSQIRTRSRSSRSATMCAVATVGPRSAADSRGRRGGSASRSHFVGRVRAWEGVVAELFETAHVRRALGPLRVVA